jgi:hypothetical protein
MPSATGTIADAVPSIPPIYRCRYIGQALDIDETKLNRYFIVTVNKRSKQNTVQKESKNRRPQRLSS